MVEHASTDLLLGGLVALSTLLSPILFVALTHRGTPRHGVQDQNTVVRWWKVAGLYCAIALPTSFLLEHAPRFLVSQSRHADRAPGGWIATALWSLTFEGVVLVCVSMFIFWAMKRNLSWWKPASQVCFGIVLLGWLIGPNPGMQLSPFQNQELIADVNQRAADQGIGEVVMMTTPDPIQEPAFSYAYSRLLGPATIVISSSAVSLLSVEEQKAIFVHELGHLALRHSFAKVCFWFLFLPGLFWATDRLARRGIAPWLSRRRVGRFEEVSMLPAFMLSAGVLVLAVSPVYLAFQRQLEKNADEYAAMALGDGRAHLKSALTKIYAANDLPIDPPALHEALRMSHPSLRTRLDRL